MCGKNSIGGYIAIAVGIFVAFSVANHSQAATKLPAENSIQYQTEEFEGLQIRKLGKGPAAVFIPGLNSSSDVFTETCAAIKKNYTCYLIQLPGFAGQAATHSEKTFLIQSRDSVEHYIHQKKLGSVILIGHSLGGLLSQMISLDAPDSVKKIVVIDSLPFYSAIQNPTATVETSRPYAEQMRAGMMQQSDENFFKNSLANMQGMSNQSGRMETLINWSKTSDRNTTTQALYDIMTTDLRAAIGNIKVPVMVLGSWAAYKAYGATLESTKSIFTTQYAQLKNVDIRMSETGFHFLMWDDADWVNNQIADFLSKK